MTNDINYLAMICGNLLSMEEESPRSLKVFGENFMNDKDDHR